MSSDSVGISAVLICVGIFVNEASKGETKKSPLFFVAILWMIKYTVLIPYYLPGFPEVALLPAISSYCCLIGATYMYLKARKRNLRKDHSLSDKTREDLYRRSGAVATTLLVLMAMIKTPVIASIMHNDHGIGLSTPNEVWLSMIVTGLSFIWLWGAVYELYRIDDRLRRRFSLAMGALLLAHMGLEVAYGFTYQLHYAGNPETMGAFFKIAFSCTKILQSILVVIILKNNPLVSGGTAIGGMGVMGWLRYIRVEVGKRLGIPAFSCRRIVSAP